MFYRRILVAISAIIAAALVCGVARAQDDGLGEAMTIINSQQEKISILERKNAQLSQTVQQLQEKVAQMEKKNLPAAAGVKVVPAAADDTLRNENDGLRAKNNELLERIGSLEMELKQVKTEAAMKRSAVPGIKPEAKNFHEAGSEPAVEGESGLETGVPAAGTDKKPVKKKFSVDLDYWDGEMAGENGSLDQKFFPSVRAFVKIQDDWSLEMAKMSGAETRDTAGALTTRVTAFGVRYTMKGGSFFSLCKHSIRYDVSFPAPLAGFLTRGDIDVNGLRLAAGKPFKVSKNWTFTTEAGYGVNTGADVTAVTVAGAGAGTSDADEYDFDLAFVYRSSPNGLKGRLGYREFHTGITSSAGSEDMNLRGMFFGIGYDF